MNAAATLKQLTATTWLHHFGTGWQHLEFQSTAHAKKFASANGCTVIPKGRRATLPT